MEKNILLSARGLSKNFPVSGRRSLQALSEVDLDIYEGETLALVGESGCGKSTLGRTLIRLIPATSGSISFEGQDIGSMSEREFRPLRPKMQIIFQDPYASLNPRMTVRDIIAEPLKTHHICASAQETTQSVYPATNREVSRQLPVEGQASVHPQHVRYDFYLRVVHKPVILVVQITHAHGEQEVGAACHGLEEAILRCHVLVPDIFGHALPGGEVVVAHGAVGCITDAQHVAVAKHVVQLHIGTGYRVVLVAVMHA